MLLVGNDVVDLTLPACINKSKDTRFVNRVFHPEEKAAILQSANPDKTLWIMWAAKETAYKIISKIDSPPVFSHKKFITEFEDLTNLAAGMCTLRGRVCFETFAIQLKVVVNADKIHAFGSCGLHETEYFQQASTERFDASLNQKWLSGDALGFVFSKREMETVKSLWSALVRHNCKLAIAGALGIDVMRLQIIRPLSSKKTLPPFLFLDDHRANIDISLSHHGQWVAWAISIEKGMIISCKQ